VKPTATIRTFPADFVVEELPAYEPSGEGAHGFVLVRKTGLTTLECARRLAGRFGVEPRDVGYAGMKDRHAVTTQWFSFPVQGREPLDGGMELGLQGVELLRATRHGNKLRTGHLQGNRFRVVLRGMQPEQAAAEVTAQLLGAQRGGVPNGFGPQRFGRDGSNPQRALAWLRGESRGPSAPREKRLLVSSVQSMLFDEVLRRRVQDGTWNTVVAGDLAQRHDSGGLFGVEQVDAETERAARGEISATGPMFGTRMRWPSGQPERIEREVLQELLGGEALLERFGKLGQGSRRPLRLMPSEVAVSPGLEPGVLIAEFVLPKGAYATTFLSMACELVDATRRSSETSLETTPDDEMLQQLQPDSG
jgi:tRNA pseudouridine13 synthase